MSYHTRFLFSLDGWGILDRGVGICSLVLVVYVAGRFFFVVLKGLELMKMLSL